MYARKILCPIDFSMCSEEAIKLATALARDTGATLLVTHVEGPINNAEGAIYGTSDSIRASLKARLSQIVPTDPSVAYEHRYEIGIPAKVIVALAIEEDVDFIVMGTHGRTGLKHLVMGSVAESVMRRAPCPVVTVKPSAATKVSELVSPARWLRQGPDEIYQMTVSPFQATGELGRLQRTDS